MQPASDIEFERVRPSSEWAAHLQPNASALSQRTALPPLRVCRTACARAPVSLPAPQRHRGSWFGTTGCTRRGGLACKRGKVRLGAGPTFRRWQPRLECRQPAPGCQEETCQAPIAVLLMLRLGSARRQQAAGGTAVPHTCGRRAAVALRCSLLRVACGSTSPTKAYRRRVGRWQT